MTPVEGGLNVAVFARNASQIFLCLFDEAGERETARIACPVARATSITASFGGSARGAATACRADGPYDLARGHRYDPAKLLVDPYAKLIDGLSATRRTRGAARRTIDTAPFMPRAIVTAQALEPAGRRPDAYGPPGPDLRGRREGLQQAPPGHRPALRGTLAALAEPAAIEHLAKLGVTHVELMPIAAWMDERHLPPLGLANAWGYNPILFMAPDPRLAPGGVGELRATVASLHQAGISVILDVVYNHTAEGDAAGPTASLRGLDNAVYFRHVADDPGRLVNDTACGNTLACDRAPVIRLVMDAMRHWVDGGRASTASASISRPCSDAARGATRRRRRCSRRCGKTRCCAISR